MQQHPSFAPTDAGRGSLRDYRYNLVPNSHRVRMVLAGSDDGQEEIERLSAAVEPRAFVAKRTADEERTDAPIPVRLFAEGRMSGVVGWVPRGLESVVIEALSRLELSGRDARIPVELRRGRHGWRVVLLMGLTR
ncbi:MAG: hypothetical protein QM635_10725 [Microbacteriaceae bacterium]